MPRLTNLNSTRPRSKKPTFIFSSIPSSIDEGSNGTFNIATTSVPDSTILYWTIQTNSGDFGTSTGSFTITNKIGSFTVTPTIDVTTEGNETFTVAIRTDSITGKIVATSNAVTINDTSVTEPGSILYTSGVANTRTAAQTTYTWTVPSGVTSISYVLTGGGGGGGIASFSGAQWVGGGGGGATAYRNNVAVTPGQSITVVVGSGGFAPSISGSWSSTSTTPSYGGPGGNSSVNTNPGHAGSTTTAGGGGAGTANGGYGTGGLPSGVYDNIGTNAGQGGSGGQGYGGGGGGGGGFSGRGGQGSVNPALGNNGGGTNGTGGAGGGGSHGTYQRGVGNYVRTGGYGGGGAGQTDGVYTNYLDGTTGTLAYRHDSIGPSLRIGAGGGATYTVSSVTQTSGAYANYGTTGAVRIIWPGNTRQFPSTNVYVQNSSGTWV